LAEVLISFTDTIFTDEGHISLCTHMHITSHVYVTVGLQ